MNNDTFDTLGLSEPLSRALADMGFVIPTPIQAQAVPPMLEGRDIIGLAQTGTGKTAAFAIPIIQNLDPESTDVQAVVLCPTRELAMQVAEEFRKLAKHYDNIRTVCLYGGQPIFRQHLALQNHPQIIVGTPGRMLDHLWQGTLALDKIKTLVLDEADEMLNMGFRDDIDAVLCHVPQTGRQTVLFSATMPKAILELTRRYQQNPQRVEVKPKPAEVGQIEQQCFQVGNKGKLAMLTRLIDSYQLTLSLVFCNTKRQVDDLTRRLQAQGYPATALHGGLTQAKRDSIMGRFRRGAIPILVATDVAARGIDVNDIQAVFNYDMPEDTEIYVHRIGRTGRAGKTGLAFSFIPPNQMYRLQAVQKILNCKLQLHTIPGGASGGSGIVPSDAADAGQPHREKPKSRRSHRRSGSRRGKNPNALREAVQ